MTPEHAFKCDSMPLNYPDEEIKEQIQNDKSLIGDMDNPQINVGEIDLYEFDKANAKENKREKVGIER